MNSSVKVNIRGDVDRCTHEGINGWKISSRTISCPAKAEALQLKRLVFKV